MKLVLSLTGVIHNIYGTKRLMASVFCV